ncbi:hypothetical protein JW979_04860 [bacterium]|nr:hypothetical protein [candidate division CSSED10-310 bacterium]
MGFRNVPIKIYLGLAIVLLFVFFSGCGDGNIKARLEGVWTATITEGEQSTDVKLMINVTAPEKGNNKSDKSEITGTFTILNNVGKDIPINKPIEIKEVELLNRRLRFTVPVTGNIDGDSLVFELILQSGRMSGSVREFREGQSDIRVVFIREK